MVMIKVHALLVLTLRFFLFLLNFFIPIQLTSLNPLLSHRFWMVKAVNYFLSRCPLIAMPEYLLIYFHHICLDVAFCNTDAGFDARSEP